MNYSKYLIKSDSLLSGRLFSAYASTEFYVLRVRNNESIAFLIPFLLSEVVQSVFTNYVDGSQHPRFKKEDILNLVVPPQLFKGLSIPGDSGSSAYFGIYTLGRYISFASNN